MKTDQFITKLFNTTTEKSCLTDFQCNVPRHWKIKMWMLPLLICEILIDTITVMNFVVWNYSVVVDIVVHVWRWRRWACKHCKRYKRYCARIKFFVWIMMMRDIIHSVKFGRMANIFWKEKKQNFRICYCYCCVKNTSSRAMRDHRGWYKESLRAKPQNISSRGTWKDEEKMDMRWGGREVFNINLCYCLHSND